MIYNYNGENIDTLDADKIIDLSNYGDLSTSSGFEAAFNAAIADNSIEGISIPYGNYDIQNSLVLRSRFKVFGNNSTIHARAANIDVFHMHNVNNILIDAVNISMHQSVTATRGCAFHMYDVSDITIRNLAVYGIAVRAIELTNTDMTAETNGNNRLVLENMRLTALGQPNQNQPEWPYGMLLVNIRNSIIRHCTVKGASRTSIGLKNYSYNCYVYDNYIEGSNHGLALASDVHDGTKVSRDVFFSGNIVKNSDYPLWIGETERINVFNNSLKGGGMFIQRVSDGSFNSNVFDNSDTTGSHLLHLGECDNLMIDSNIYKINGNSELFDIVDNQPNVYVGGLFDGRKIDILNPTSGTPRTTSDYEGLSERARYMLLRCLRDTASNSEYGKFYVDTFEYALNENMQFVHGLGFTTASLDGQEVTYAYSFGGTTRIGMFSNDAENAPFNKFNANQDNIKAYPIHVPQGATTLTLTKPEKLCGVMTACRWDSTNNVWVRKRGFAGEKTAFNPDMSVDVSGINDGTYYIVYTFTPNNPATGEVTDLRTIDLTALGYEFT